MHPATKVANRLLRLAWAAGRHLTPMQLLKLVFMCHGWMLGLYHRPLICEPVQAWKYGPVIPELYRAIRSYRNQPVTRPIGSTQDDGLDTFEEDLIRQVFEAYGEYDGITLSHITHENGSPWDQTFSGERNIVIPNDVIEDYYDSLARRAAG
jgi:uncharacterized phage-associated protein